MKARFSFLLVVASALSLPGITFADRLPEASDSTIQLSYEMLTKDTQATPFRVEKAFKVILAAYKQQIAEINEDASLSADQKKRLTDRTLARVDEMLVLYDNVVSVTPIVFAATFNFFGIELPVPLTRKIPWIGKLGMLSGQGSVGLTMVETEHQGSGKKSFAVGATLLSGPTFTFGGPGAPGDKRPGASGIKMYMGFSLILPFRANVPFMRMGDLQGWYMGGALEGSIDLGALSTAPKTVQIGAYFPTSLDAMMLFFFAGTGAQDRPIAAQVEALNFTSLWASDGSDPRSPIPFTANWSTSPHAPKERLKELKANMPTADQMKEAIERANRNLENVR